MSMDGASNKTLLQRLHAELLKTLRPACSLNEWQPASTNEGTFDTRDEALERFGSLQFTLRGRAF